MSRSLGYVPDQQDVLDKDAGPALRAGAAIIPVVVNRNPYTMTFDQGGIGSCTANAAGQALRADMVKQKVATGMPLQDAQNTTDIPARLWGYNLARNTHGMLTVDSGPYIRTIFLVYNQLGFCEERYFPYTDNKGPGAPVFKLPPSNAYRMAFDQKMAAENGGNKLVSYRRIFSTGYKRVEEVKLAHGKMQMVVFGTDVSHHFCSDLSANNGKEIDPPKGLSIAGGHAMVTGGHDPNGCDVLNSWGTIFGDLGWCRFSWDYIAWEKTLDLWVVECAPIFS